MKLKLVSIGGNGWNWKNLPTLVLMIQKERFQNTVAVDEKDEVESNEDEKEETCY